MITEKDILGPEEIKQLILAAKPGLYRTIIATIAYTGMRHDEALALRWSEVEPLEAGEVRVRRTLSTARVKGEENQTGFRWFDPKTEAGLRDIPIPKDLIEYLRDWKRRCPQSRHDLVFPSPLGEPLHRSNILRYGLYPAIEQARLKEITMHGLRHSYASMLIILKRPITEISRYLGHKDVSVTQRIYAHFLKPKAKDTMTDLARMINGA
jgi:integrase